MEFDCFDKRVSKQQPLFIILVPAIKKWTLIQGQLYPVHIDRVMNLTINLNNNKFVVCSIVRNYIKVKFLL